MAEAQITKNPEGRQASAIIPLLLACARQKAGQPFPAIETCL